MSISRPSATALAAAGLAGVLVLGLSACTPEPAPTPSSTAEPSASDAPIFASDEEALAAAVKAYEAYESVSYAIAADGGEDAGRISTTVTQRYAAQLEREFAQYVEAGIRAEGDVKLTSYELVKYDKAEAAISIYVCRDVSDVRVVDATGKDVTPNDRRDITPLQAFLVLEEDEGKLLVDKVELWAGADFC